MLALTFGIIAFWSKALALTFSNMPFFRECVLGNWSSSAESTTRYCSSHSLVGYRRSSACNSWKSSSYGYSMFVLWFLFTYMLLALYELRMITDYIFSLSGQISLRTWQVAQYSKLVGHYMSFDPQLLSWLWFTFLYHLWQHLQCL